MAEQTWFVKGRGAITQEGRSAIDAAGGTITGSSGGGFAGPGGELPEPTSHTVAVRAPTAAEAVAQLQRAVEQHALFVDPEAHPAD